jgi:hypothetical protein
MPWKECHVMDERLQFVARRLDGEKMAALPSTPRSISATSTQRRPVHRGCRPPDVPILEGHAGQDRSEGVGETNVQ